MWRSFRNDESGFSLIEVLVSALIVAIMATGVVGSLSVASRSSGRTKMRGAAASLAQQDQERLRTLKVSALDGLDTSRDVPVCTGAGGSCITYHVASKTNWVADTGTAASCSGTGHEGYNLELTTTVTWPGMAAQGLNPVVEDSMLSPGIGTQGSTVGTLAVKVVRSNGSPAGAGLTVTLGGAGSGTATTGANGCAVFDSLDAGAYTANLNQPGWVDSTMTQSVTKSATVVGQKLASISFTYDQPSSASLTFYAKIGTTTYTGIRVDQATIYQGTNNRVFGTAANLQTTISTPAAALFPGTWNVYAGGCTANKPSTWLDLAPTLPVTSNATGLNVPVTGSNPPGPGVQVPSFDYKLTINGVAPTSTNAAWIKLTSTSCPAYGSNQQNVNTSGVDVGKVPLPGYPFGTYNVCASAFVNGSRRYKPNTGVSLSNYGNTLTTFNFKNTTSTTSC